jgi:hypothetical protein
LLYKPLVNLPRRSKKFLLERDLARCGIIGACEEIPSSSQESAFCANLTYPSGIVSDPKPDVTVFSDEQAVSRTTIGRPPSHQPLKATRRGCREEPGLKGDPRLGAESSVVGNMDV